MSEEWRQVVGFPNYEISSLGNVRSSNGTLTPFMHNKYLRVSLVRRKGSFVQKSVHELVLEAFIEPRPSGFQSHHKNGVRTDNNVENLEWLSSREHRKAHRKLDEDTRKAIQFQYELGGMTQKQLAFMYDVGIATINRIVKRKEP